MARLLDIISVSDIVQILILYLAIYAILKRAKGSRFGQSLTGVGILAAAMIAFTFLFHFEVLSAILRSLLVYLAISSVVIFQPEIRRFLSQIGALGYLERRRYGPDGAATPKFIAETVAALAAKRMGALFAFERGISLRGYEDNGVALNATFSRELVECVFTPPLPLHDGGMTLRNGRISAAHCVFPVSNNPDLDVSGMRHRAAVGLSEETDALVVVVSEESGAVSVAYNGRIVSYPCDQCVPSLERWLLKALPDEKQGGKTLAGIFERIAKGFRK